MAKDTSADSDENEDQNEGTDETLMEDAEFLAELAKRVDVTFEDLNIEDLNVDGGDDGYQRVVDPAKVDRMIREFNPLLLDPIVVSMRPDGSYWVVDGHHRLEMYRRIKATKVPCRLVFGLERPDEARLFIAMAKGRKAISPYATHRAKLVANDADAWSIQNTLSGLGFKLIEATGRSAHEITDGSPFPIAAVSAVNTLHGLDGGVTLAETLALIREVWSVSDPDVATERFPMLGLGRFLSRCRGQYDDKRLLAALRRTSPEVVKSKGDARAALDGKINKAEGFALAIVEMYNKGLPVESSKRIPDEVVR